MTDPGGASFSQERLERESLAWVTQLLSGAMTAEDAEAFRAWRAQSPAHETAFVQTLRFQRAVRRAGLADEALSTAVPPARVKTMPLARRSWALSGLSARLKDVDRRVFIGGALACSAAVVVAEAPGGLWPSLSDLMADYHTVTGQRQQLALATGMAAELNTQTTIDFDKNQPIPELVLLTGEVAVSVRRNGLTPAAVRSGAGRTYLQQARVNVRELNGSVCVTCIEGAVLVEHDGQKMGLAAGHQVSYTSDRIGRSVTVDAGVTTAWRRGLLIFRNEPLQQVVAELNRYRQGHIVLVGSELAQRPVYGIFEIDRIDDAVDQVRRLTGAKATAMGNIVLLT